MDSERLMDGPRPSALRRSSQAPSQNGRRAASQAPIGHAGSGKHMNDKAKRTTNGSPRADGRMGSSDLKPALWNAANTLRGSAVDRTDWKGYILPVLFFKRISDVWDEETAEARELYGEADPTLFPEIHRFCRSRRLPLERRAGGGNQCGCRASTSHAGDRACKPGHALSSVRKRGLGGQREVLG